VRDLARASVLQLWEATARERGDATLWPKSRRGPAVTPAAGRALTPPPKLLPPTSRLPLEQRFWSRVDKTDDCWLWTAGTARGRPWFEATRAEGRESDVRLSVGVAIERARAAAGQILMEHLR